MLPSPEEQQKIDMLAKEVMQELRRVTLRNLRVDMVRTILFTIFAALFLWLIS